MSTKPREGRHAYTFEQEVVEKLARIQNMLATIIEKLEGIEDRLSSIEGVRERQRKAPTTYRVVSRDASKGHPLVDVLREVGIIFESDLTRAKNRDRVFEHLRREGAIVIAGQRERVAVTKEFLDSFLSELAACRGPAEAEAKLKNEKFLRFYAFLRDSGLLTYDSRSGWSVHV